MKKLIFGSILLLGMTAFMSVTAMADSDSNSSKCGSEKCGSDTPMKCGAGKCGGGK